MTAHQEVEEWPRKRKERDDDEQRALAAPSASGVPVPIRAGVGVLDNRVLWDTTMGFMDGYPHAVYMFYEENDPSTLALRVQQNDPRDWSDRQPDSVAFGIVGHLIEVGVLPHLAIAVNDPEMLQALYKLSKHPQYQRDPKLSFREVMRCAVAFNSVDMVECINELKAQDPDWKWGPNLMRLAVQRDNPDFQAIDWLYAHLPRKGYPLLEKFMLHQARQGALDVARWLHEHG